MHNIRPGWTSFFPLPFFLIKDWSKDFLRETYLIDVVTFLVPRVVRKKKKNRSIKHHFPFLLCPVLSSFSNAAVFLRNSFKSEGHGKKKKKTIEPSSFLRHWSVASKRCVASKIGYHEITKLKLTNLSKF